MADFYPEVKAVSSQDGVKIRARSIEMNGWEPEPILYISEWEGKSQRKLNPRGASVSNLRIQRNSCLLLCVWVQVGRCCSIEILRWWGPRVEKWYARAVSCARKLLMLYRCCRRRVCRECLVSPTYLWPQWLHLIR